MKVLPLRWQQFDCADDRGPYLGNVDDHRSDIADTLSVQWAFEVVKLIVDDRQFPPTANIELPASRSGTPLPATHSSWISEPSPRVYWTALSLPQLRDFALHGRAHGMASFLSACVPAGKSPARCRRRCGIWTIQDITRGGMDISLLPPLDDDVLAALTPAPGFSACCPSLKTLTVNYCTLISDAALSAVGHRADGKREWL
ncbi:hypothetical protein B0H14DRAFT_3758434 [Mycena olivaceomarginata]|nr:hypothetical protein B0H14DRAFT_3758434 [Mycena olivaceomarginata]